MSPNVDARFEQLIQKIDPQNQLRRVWTLTGGVSAQVTGLEMVRANGSTIKMIVRQHGDADFNANPTIATDEFKLLHRLHGHGLPTPMPYFMDISCQIFERPVIVMEFIEGTTDFAPAPVQEAARQLAQVLAKIHAVELSTHDWSFLPDQMIKDAAFLRVRPTRLDESLDEGRIREVLEGVFPFPDGNPPVLLHGDFWLGNTLWQEGRLISVIDWEDAGVGEPLSDLASARMELLWSSGMEAMHSFTVSYQTLMPTLRYDSLPYWDLLAAILPAFKIALWAGDDATEARMRAQHHWFVEQAMVAIQRG